MLDSNSAIIRQRKHENHVLRQVKEFQMPTINVNNERMSSDQVNTRFCNYVDLSPDSDFTDGNDQL